MLLSFSSWFSLFQEPRSHMHAKQLIGVYGVNWASQGELVVKNPPANAGVIRDMSLTPGSGRSPGGGHGNPLQYSCLDRGAWWATVQRVTQSWTRLK